MSNAHRHRAARPGRAPFVPTTQLQGGVHWIAPLFTPTGYGDEARGFVAGLRRLRVPMRVEAIQTRLDFARSLAADDPEFFVDVVAMMNQPVRQPETAVVHTGATAPFGRVPGAAHTVVRTMWETDGLPEQCVAGLNSVDEVWVPSQFNVDTFRQAGVRAPIQVVGGGVDAQRFRPGLKPLVVPGRRSQLFLAMFEWSYRKGWDVLLRAWAQAFRADDDVALVLRIYPRNRFDNDSDLPALAESLVDGGLQELGLDRGRMAPILTLGSHMAPADVPRLFAAADCYVAPSRGEGWGRPQHEAMACGLPVIGTRWGGSMEFMDDSNALLLEIEGLVPVDERMDVPLYHGQRWAEPSVDHLAELLRHVIEHPEGARGLGQRARQAVEQRWQWRHVARTVLERLVALRAEPPSARAPAVSSKEEAAGTARTSVATTMAACTIVTRRDLPFARVLARTYTAHHPSSRFTTLVLDDPTGSLDGRGEPFQLVRLADLGIDRELFSRMASYYEAGELAAAMKPWVLAHLLTSSPTAIYLDPRAAVYGPFDGLSALAERHGIVITPHVTRPMPRDGLLPDESALLASGMYNLGFICLGPSAEEFLRFWITRLVDDGISEPTAMRFADQRWVDFVPSLFAHHILRDPGYNVAYWNLHERALTLEGNRYLVNGAPLRVFHFSGFDPDVPDRLSEHAGDRPRVAIEAVPALAAICSSYRQDLLAAGFADHRHLEYGFARLPDGRAVTHEMRRAYLNRVLQAKYAGRDMPRGWALDARTPPATRPVASDPGAEGAPSPETEAVCLNGVSARTSHPAPPTSGPLVSVIVPVRNRARLVAEALRSALCQTYQNLEVIVVDNASTDETCAVVGELARADARLQLHRNPVDVGMVENFKVGLRLASGEYVKFLCSDDRLLPRAVERLVFAIRSSDDIAVATSARALIDEEGRPLPAIASTAHLSETDVVLRGRGLANLLLVKALNLLGEPSTVLFRRELVTPADFAKLDGLEYTTLLDVATWLRLLLAGNAAYVAEPLSETRLHSSNAGNELRAIVEPLEWSRAILSARALGLLEDPAEEEAALRNILARSCSALAGQPEHPRAAELADALRGLVERLARLGDAGSPVTGPPRAALAPAEPVAV